MKRLSIFGRLHGRRDEDAQTEAFVGTLDRLPRIRDRTVSRLVEIPGLRVERFITQAIHGSDRPDVQIEASDPLGHRHIIFLESKVGAQEGWRQLPRYAECLSRLIEARAAHHGHLVYVPAKYDPKEPPPTAQDPRSGVRFHQHRWNAVHRIIRNALEDFDTTEEEAIWCTELLDYLEERGMTDPTTFAPEDLLGLTRLPRLIRLLEACLEGPVWPRFQAVVGKHSGAPNWALQVRDHDRYVYRVEQPGGWWGGLGFLLGARARDEAYPDLAVVLETTRAHANAPHVLNAFEALAKRESGPWKHWQWSTEWPGVYASMSVRHLLQDPDHIEAARAWFLARLTELETFREAHQELGWSPAQR